MLPVADLPQKGSGYMAIEIEILKLFFELDREAKQEVIRFLHSHGDFSEKPKEPPSHHAKPPSDKQ